MRRFFVAFYSLVFCWLLLVFCLNIGIYILISKLRPQLVNVKVAHHHFEEGGQHLLFGVFKVGKCRCKKSAVGFVNEQGYLLSLLGESKILLSLVFIGHGGGDITLFLQEFDTA